MSNEEDKKKLYELAKDVVEHNDARVALEKYQRLFVSALARDIVNKVGREMTDPVVQNAVDFDSLVSILFPTIRLVREGKGLDIQHAIDAAHDIQRYVSNQLAETLQQLKDTRCELATVKNHLANLGNG